MAGEAKVRINKFLATAGICSRREADRLVAAGKVTVNGQVAEPGILVNERDEITVGGKAVAERQPEKVVLAYYKPLGVTCTARDRHAERALGDIFRYPVRVTYAGRLDKESEGLLLMTNDGLLIERMMRGSNGHEREYAVKIDREITPEFIEKMQAGIFLRELNITTRPCRITATGKYSFRIILTQGVNRQIRRMCGELGFRVKSLKRLRVENIELAKLRPGEYRVITGEELRELYRCCQMEGK